MFDLDAAVHAWREEITSHRSLSTSDLDELEDHVRCTYGSLARRGVEPERAWERAREGLGACAELSAEFRRADGLAWHRLLMLGWAMFALAFFLPVHRYGDTLFHTSLSDGMLPGVQALLVALLQNGPLGAVSALTNLVMPLTMWRIRDRARPGLLALTGLTGAAFVLNVSWLVLARPIADLRVGYFLWWASFGVVTGGLALRAYAAPAAAAPVTSS